MKQVPGSDPQRILYRGGGGFLALLGLVLLLAGVGFLAGAMASRKGHGTWVPLSIVGLGLSTAGMLALLNRRGLEIDASARRWRAWWGLLVPLRSREGSLDDMKHVSIDVEWRRSKNHSYKVYPVRIRGHSRSNDIEITTPTGYPAARRCAEDLAKAIQLPLVDSSSGEIVSRQPGEVDESLRDHARREGKAPMSLADPPAGMLSQFEVDGGKVRIIIPPPGMSKNRLWPLVPVLIIECIIVAVLLLKFLDAGARPESWLAIAIIGGIAVLMPLSTILSGSAYRRVTVEASPKSIWVKKKASFGRPMVAEISTDLVEEITAGDAITVRSDTRTISFGEHLSREEKTWIRAVLEQVLTA